MKPNIESLALREITKRQSTDYELRLWTFKELAITEDIERWDMIAEDLLLSLEAELEDSSDPSPVVTAVGRVDTKETGEDGDGDDMEFVLLSVSVHGQPLHEKLGYEKIEAIVMESVKSCVEAWEAPLRRRESMKRSAAWS